MTSKLKILIPVAHYHEGNTGEYVQRAFAALGHEAKIVGAGQFYSGFKNGEADLFFCVDSGEPLDLRPLLSPGPADLSKVAFWFIDYRHNRNRPERTPNDFSNAKFLHDNGGTIFQAQYEDAEECLAQGMSSCHWLPVAADPDIWSDKPVFQEKKFDLAFIGNLWDQARVDALKLIQQSGLRLAFFGHGAVWKEKAAEAVRLSRAGFNISSFYGERYAYDINMRFFETLSCGVPVITNRVPSLSRLIPEKSFVVCYDSLSDIVPVIRNAFSREEFFLSGKEARQWIMENATYGIRMQKVLEVMRDKL